MIENLILNFKPSYKKNYQDESFFIVAENLKNFLPLSETNYQIVDLFKMNYIQLTLEEGLKDFFLRWCEEKFIIKNINLKTSFFLSFKKAYELNQNLDYSYRYLFGLIKKKNDFQDSYSYFLDQKKVKILPLERYLRFTHFDLHSYDLIIIIKFSQKKIQDFGFFERRFFKNFMTKDLFYVPSSHFEPYFYSKNNKLKEKILPTDNLEFCFFSEKDE